MKDVSRQAAMNARRARWRQIIAEVAESNIPVRRFCQQRNLNESQLYWWRRALAREDASPSQAEPHFVRVAMESAPAAKSVADLELTLGRGWVLRIPRDIEESALRSVLGALRAIA
jgi:transposase-like protein